MWAAVMAGKPCVFGDDDPRQQASPEDWGPESIIRGHVLAELLIRAGASKPPTIRQVRIQGARVIGEVDLSHAEVATTVRLRRCLVEDNVLLHFARTRTLQVETCVLASVRAQGASIEGALEITQSRVQCGIAINGARVSHSVVLSGSTIASDGGPALNAERLEAGGSVFLRDGFQATGEVWLLGAQISGQLNCSQGQFENPNGVALGCDGANIRGGTFLHNGFRAAGEVRLLGARIGGELNCFGGRFKNRSGYAIRADGAHIEGSTNLHAGFHATGLVHLVGTRMGADLNCSGGRFDNPRSTALAADSAEIGGSVILNKPSGVADGFHATGMVRLRNARVTSHLDCSGGRVENPEGIALAADGMSIRGDAAFCEGFYATGIVQLLGARIGGSLNCSGGQFENPMGRALAADGAEIGVGVFLNKHPGSPTGFNAAGTVQLTGARIAGQLNCSGGRFDNPGGIALIADGAEIGVGVFLNRGPADADGFHATGEVRFPGAQIIGQFNCSGGRFDNPEGNALAVDGANIQGGARLDAGFHATGEVALRGARVRDDLNCSGGRLENPAGIALSADQAEIGKSVLLSKLSGSIEGFHASGAVKLLGARIGGQLNCNGGQFHNCGGTALSLQEARTNSLWLCNLHPTTAGVIDLLGARVSLLVDDRRSLASPGVFFRLDGFVYERIAPDSPQDVNTRLQWLERQGPDYHPQPFDQLAAVFQRSGRDHEAARVLIEKRRKRRETFPNRWHKNWDRFLDCSVRYGWQAWRPLVGGAAIFLLVFALVVAAQAVDLNLGPPDTTASYHPFMHALDVFLPIIDLGIESRWAIDTTNGGAFSWLVRVSLWVLPVVGWVSVTLAVAAFTGIVRRE